MMGMGEGVVNARFDCLKWCFGMQVEKILAMDERKRKYNSFEGDMSTKPTEEEIEAWHIKKARADDPMAQFI